MTAAASMKVGTSQDQADVLALIENMHKTNYDKDAAGFAALFAADAAVFNLSPPLVHRGMELRERQAWFETWDGPVELKARDFEVTISGDFAFGHSFMHLRANSKQVARETSFWMRSTIHLKREGDEWRILHEHTSVPFCINGSFRPAFDLNP